MTTWSHLGSGIGVAVLLAVSLPARADEPDDSKQPDHAAASPTAAVLTVPRSAYEPGTLGLGGLAVGMGVSLLDGPLGAGAQFTLGLGPVDTVLGMSFNVVGQRNVHLGLQSLIASSASGTLRLSCRATYDTQIDNDIDDQGPVINVAVLALRGSVSRLGTPYVRTSVQLLLAVALSERTTPGALFGMEFGGERVSAHLSFGLLLAGDGSSQGLVSAGANFNFN